MNNLQRIQLEVKVNLPQEELSIFLQENNLNPQEEYNPSSATSKRAIYLAAISILETLANDPVSLKTYKLDDMTVSDFADNIMKRVSQMERKARILKTDEQQDSNIFMLFK